MHISSFGLASRWASMLAVLLVTSTEADAAAQEPASVDPEGRPLVVGTKEAPPFSFRDDDGVWQGLSVDLWRAVAADLGYAFELRELETADLLAGVEDGTLDAVVAAFTITAERETRFDFTHPFYISGLGIAVATSDVGGTFAVLRSFFSLRFLRALGALFLVLVLAGALLWAFERRRNADQFGGGPIKGLGAAFWWSAVTMTTVGYGDKAPVTAGGRLVALVWMFASIIIISGFTAAIASALTVRGLESRIRGPEDLPRVRVGTLQGTTSEDYLGGEGLPFRAYAAVDDGLAALASGEIDALVYDAPILRFKARRDFPGEVRVLEGTFQRQDYGIGLPTGSALREVLNNAMLTRLRDEWWPQVVARYLGE